MKLWIGKRAQEQAAKIGRWWATHREVAPDLFIDELETTFHFLCSERGGGVDDGPVFAFLGRDFGRSKLPA